MRGFGGNPTGKLFQQRTDLGFMTLHHRAQQHSTCNAEDLPPKLAGKFESVRTERFHLKSGAAQSWGCRLNRRAGLGCDGSATVVFKVADADTLQIVSP